MNAPGSDFFSRHSEKISFAGPEQCWIWTAYTTAKGYGWVWVQGRKMQMAHRMAFESAHGEGASAGFVVRHTCDVRACVNPAHLLSGTPADNSRDMVERGRWRRDTSFAGQANPSAKLTESDAVAIRAAYIPRKPGFSQYALARQYGVSQSSIASIVNHKKWTHV